MALPRRIARQLRAGRYQRSPIGKRAREAARKLQEPPPPPPPSGQTVKSRMRAKKRIVFREDIKYRTTRSDEHVDESDAYDEMLVALDFTNDEMNEFASLAAKAWHKLDTEGSAGELAVYLAYDFLWYH